MEQSICTTLKVWVASTGNAIFSRYPITSAQRIAQTDRTDLDALTETFYIRRAIGRADIDLHECLAAFVVHTGAYDEDGK